MFDYIDAREDAARALTLRPRPGSAGRRARHLEYSTSIVMDLPRDQAALRASRSSHFWSNVRRREQRFEEEFGPATFRVLTRPTELYAALPAVRELFVERWSNTYTTLRWHDAARFQPYADALVQLAEAGRGELAVLEGDGRLLGYGWNLIEPPWCHFWQHAATTSSRYRRHGVGAMLIVRMLQDLVDREGIEHLDFMIGDYPYKREWETRRRPVYLRLQEPDTALGRGRLGARVAYERFRLGLQHEPRVRRLAKQALHGLARARFVLASSTSNDRV